MSLWVKICGVNDKAHASLLSSVDAIGFMFYPRSPRFVTADDAHHIAASLSSLVAKIGVFVDSNDDVIDHVLSKVSLDGIQLHGYETNERIIDVKKRFSLPVTKAVTVQQLSDLLHAATDYPAANCILLDARGASRSNDEDGVHFDWNLLQKSTVMPSQWCLAGGINAQNLKKAITTSGATRVDVSSGVESQAGTKDPQKIEEFLKIASCL